MIFHHIPVLFQPVINLIAEHGPRRIIDATIGGAGHARGLLERLPEAQLLGIDRDDDAIAAATENLELFKDRATIRKGVFSDMKAIAASIGWDHADAVLMDIGVSSHQIDDPERGFSFRMDGPLDMRMNRQEDTMTAATLLNTASQEELETIIRDYGEEFKARFIAQEIVKRREKKPFETTGELNELLEKIIGFKHQHGLPPATRTFQALRIAVNHELDELSDALKSALELLSPNGILAVITFHSLEDRIVKHFFQYEAATCVCPPKMPVCTCGKKQTINILTRKPITADEEELKNNPRAACAKLRAAMKLDIH
ncbi:MAG: 16S rRNA (cytosine(1402)-N(4))-methyltransferase RsmH [Victivallales bacterium]|nr:16S rRNA (cytosine(1402)-N(4))-methyltransferase RsmH [Victivallales bacterium]